MAGFPIGIPIIENPLLTVTTSRTKRWRRSGCRPDKVRVRSRTLPSPSLYVLRQPKGLFWYTPGKPVRPEALGPPSIIGHPATIAKLKAAIDNAP